MDDRVVDVGYIELNSDGNEKVPLYLRIGEVAKLLSVPTSRVRFWSNTYYYLLDGEKCNTHRRFSKADVSKLRLIKELSKKNYSHERIEHELINFKFEEGDISVSIDIEEGSNDLQVQILASAIALEVDSKLNIFMDKLVQQVGEMNKQQLEQISENLNEAIADTLDEKINELKTELKSNNDDMIQEVATTIDESIEEHLKSEFIDTNNTISDLKESIKVQNEKLEEVSEYFRVATVSQNNIKEVSRKPFFDRIIDRYFK